MVVSVPPARGCGLAGFWSSSVPSKANQIRPFVDDRVLLHNTWPRRNEVRSSLNPCRSPSTVRRDCHIPNGMVNAVEPPPLPKLPTRAERDCDGVAAVLWTTWITPTNEVAPNMTGAGPRRISMRSRSWRSSVLRAGLNAPPQGTSSTTRRKASNSLRPQNSGTALAGPLSPPGATSTPVANASAPRRSVTPRSRSSSPLMTSMATGTSSGTSGARVATTSTC